MWYDEHTNAVIKTPREITRNGMVYPRQIFRRWSKSELAELGIRPARVEAPDSRYYKTCAENYNLDGDECVISYDSSEKDVEELKKELVWKVKKNVGSTLSSSDWMVLRATDGGTAMTDSWITYRNEVRRHGNALEAGIESFASVEAVRNFQNHSVTEVRYIAVSDEEGNKSPGEEKEEVQRIVDKTYWDWPVSPDAEADPYHVEYK